MNYYELVTYDQMHNNWLMFTQQRESPFVLLNPRYVGCICPKCKKIDHDKAFAEGFEEMKIRAKGDVFSTSEGFTCISEKAKQIVESSGYSGIVLKAIPKAGWWVVNVSRRVNADYNAYTVTKPNCEQCGRPKETIGLIRCLNQIEVPKETGAFFAPIFDRGGSMNGDRDIFVTEDIVFQFKKQGIKGGMFARLLTSAEYAAIKAAGAEKQPSKWPKDSRVIL